MDKTYYEKTNYCAIIRYVNRSKMSKLTLCDICNPLQNLNCRCCDWSGYTSILCNRGSDIRKLVR